MAKDSAKKSSFNSNPIISQKKSWSILFSVFLLKKEKIQKSMA